ncbi:hypothetical protein EW053_04085 [Streptomyces sp. IB2014 016-6]|nr:hypothetical protein EW053_04085 [Streptomyces sp. IB2014 016-6]
MLWRTPVNLCTDRGTALWTTSHHLRHTDSDLGFLHPPAVGEKNFSSWSKIRANGAQQRPNLISR